MPQLWKGLILVKQDIIVSCQVFLLLLTFNFNQKEPPESQVNLTLTYRHQEAQIHHLLVARDQVKFFR